MYLYSSGASRQHISILNHLGLSVSYVTLAGGGGKEIPLPGNDSLSTSDLRQGQLFTSTEHMDTVNDTMRKTGEETPPEVPWPSTSQLAVLHPVHRARIGTLERLSISMRQQIRSVAASQTFGIVYDNINMQWKVPGQIIGRTGKSCTASQLL